MNVIAIALLAMAAVQQQPQKQADGIKPKILSIEMVPSDAELLPPACKDVASGGYLHLDELTPEQVGESVIELSKSGAEIKLWGVVNNRIFVSTRCPKPTK